MRTSRSGASPGQAGGDRGRAEQKGTPREVRLRVYRIRRFSGRAGGSNYYDHADVVESHWTRALQAARQGRVTNWRRIDRFDTSDEDYCYYEHLYAVDEADAEDPQPPSQRAQTRGRIR